MFDFKFGPIMEIIFIIAVLWYYLSIFFAYRMGQFKVRLENLQNDIEKIKLRKKNEN
jgi:hypothetical protein